jgi:predicted Ser/Thr protein kinase
MPLVVTFADSRFQVVRCLGQGGMGKVYLAIDQQLGRQVALKFPRRDEGDQGIRILLEARCQAAIRHPNVVPVYEAGLLDGHLCIAMAYIEGCDLWQARASLNRTELVRLVAQAARGVHAAHSAGLIHRDLKPENILVDQSEDAGWRAYVTDFGLATWGDLQEGPAVAGTLAYMAPECLSGERLLDPRSDVYSLGAILYALATGHPPVDTEAILASTSPEGGTEPRLLSRVDPRASGLVRLIQAGPRPPRAWDLGLPADLETIILHALEDAPQRRYASALELADDLDRFLAGNPIRARRPTIAYRLVRFAGRNRALTALSACLALGLLVASGAFLELSRRAQARAFLAQQYAMRAQQIEQHIRLGHMMPPHDRTPHLVWAREHMEAMRWEADREGAIAQGPFAYLAGTTHLLVGRPQEAIVELERAWNLGYRTPQVAQGLAEAVLEARLGQAPGRDPEAAKALDLLRQVRPRQGANPLLEARIALLEGREEDALVLCGQVLAQTPWAYEAHLQEGEIWLYRLHRAGTFEELQRILDRAMDQFDAAMATAPSDPRPVLLKAFAIRQMERLRVENGHPLEGARLAQAIQLCDQAESLDPGWCRVFGERSLLRCIALVSNRTQIPPRDRGREEARMLSDAARSYALDPSQENSQAASAWAWQAVGGVAFRDRRGDCAQVLDRSEAKLRGLLAAHPRTAPLHKAMAYLLWNRMDLLQEAGGDPRPVARELIGHLRRSIELQSLRLQGVGDQQTGLAELGERLTYLAELEHVWGDSAAAARVAAEGRGILEGLRGPGGTTVFLPYLLAWNHLLQAQIQLEAGETSEARAPWVGDGVPVDGSPILDHAFNRFVRVLPFHAHLLTAQAALRGGQDPRPALRACLGAARTASLRRPASGYPLYGFLQAAIQEVRYALPRGQDATRTATEGLRVCRRLEDLEAHIWPLEPRSHLPGLGRAYFELALGRTSKPTGLRAIAHQEALRPVLACGLFADPQWLQWADPRTPPSHANQAAPSAP